MRLCQWKAISQRTQGPLPPPDAADPPLTPLYDLLTTNLTHPIMYIAVMPFPPLAAVYPPEKVVEDYLDSPVSRFDLSQDIRLNTIWSEMKQILSGESDYLVPGPGYPWIGQMVGRRQSYPFRLVQATSGFRKHLPHRWWKFQWT